MRFRIANTLGIKFALALGGGLLVTSLAFLVLFVALYQAQLTAERSNASEHVNLLFEASLENAMLKRDLEGLERILHRLAGQDGVRSVMIATPTGEVRFAAPTAHLGETLSNVDHSSTLFQNLADGREVLRSIRRVRNKPECGQCHGSITDNPVNGVLVVDWDASTIRANARNSTLILIVSGGGVVLFTVLGAAWLVRRLVLRRLRALQQVAQKIIANDLSVRMQVTGDDEIDRLAKTYNHMLEIIHRHIDELEERRFFLQSLIDAIPDGLRVLDRDGRILLANKAYRRQLGLADTVPMIGTLCHASAHGRERPCPDTMIICPLAALSAATPEIKAVHTHQRADGSSLEVEIYAALLQSQGQDYVVESIRDLASHARFGHEQKLAAVGELAAGVAHEIGNPLASIRLALQGIIKDHLHDAPRLVEYLRLVDGQIDKCIDVNSRLLRLSGGAAQQRQLISVNVAVRETLSLLSYQAEQAHVIVDLDLDPTEPRLLILDGDFRMVILNLVQNAFHAMPKGGSLRIITREANDWLMVKVADSGVGIAQADQLRIFEPFFTKRADGRSGTGLGLAICRSIVHENRGSIAVVSEVGVGSTFTVKLPSVLATMALEAAGHEQKTSDH